MWIAYIIPGTVAFAVALFLMFTVLLAEIENYKPVKKGLPFIPKTLMFLIVLWGCLDILPTVVNKTDIYCDNDTQIGAGASPLCQLHKVTVFIVMMMNYLFMTWLVESTVAITSNRTGSKMGTWKKVSRLLSLSRIRFLS
jgi:hypothetical protein